MSEIRCHRCGRSGVGNTLEWSSSSTDGVLRSLCGQCTRLHVRDIESKLDDEWWRADTRAVLVVEDDDNTRLLIRMSLESAGYVVDEAATGEEAVDLLAAGHLPVAMVVDVALPGELDGWGVREQVREIDESTPVIIISAHGSDATGKPQKGNKSFLEKPFDMDVLIDLVDRRTAGQAGVGRA